MLQPYAKGDKPVIIGIGADITEIWRIEAAIKKERFMRKVFTQPEIVLFESRGRTAKVLAGNFAAKEAVAKAFGCGFSGFSPVDVEILRDSLGKPFVNLYGNAAKIKEELNIEKIHLSLSNCNAYAVAYVVAEG